MSKIVVEHIPTVRLYKIGRDEFRAKLVAAWGWKRIDLEDQWYFYPRWEDWDVIFQHVQKNLPKYVPDAFDCEVETELAYAMGLFFADGSCCLPNLTYAGATWNLINTKPELLERCIPALEQKYSSLKFKVKQYSCEAKGRQTNYGMRNFSLYHLEANVRERHNDGIRGKFIKDWQYLFYFDGDKTVPACISESSLVSQKAFMQGVIDGDGYKAGKRIYVYGSIGAVTLTKIMRNIGWRVRRYKDKRKPNNYMLDYDDKTEDLTKPHYCDNFSMYISVMVAKNFQCNTCARVEGNMSGERHKWNVFFDGDAFYQLESQKYTPPNMIADLDDPGYVPEEIEAG